MAGTKGCGATLSLGADIVASLSSISNPISADSLDITTFDSECVREFISGLKSMTIDVSGYYDPTDTAGQIAMLTAMLAGTVLTSAQKPEILWNGINGITADAIIESLTVEAAVDGIIGFSATLKCTGTIAVV